MTFNDLSLHPGILKAIEDAGYTAPTPIQSAAIPVIVNKSDLIATAQTGTGKTAAFVLPTLHLLTAPSSVRSQGPRALVLVPTRELAIQVAAEITRYSIHLPRMKTVCIYGGAPYPIQNRDLSRPYEILVATPGRLMDHVERGRIDFSRTEILILDEADRMLDMGFIDPVEEIAALLPQERQTLMFSATLSPEIQKLTRRLLRNPEKIEISHVHDKHENIEQRIYYTDSLSHKNDLLDHLLTDPEINQALVFTSTKRHADELLDHLIELGHDVAALHGDMNQRQRTRTITMMRQGKIKVLVATDVAARGLDVQTISHVINFDLPRNVEDYVHRIGRTGRAGAQGIALSFASGKEIPLVRRIEQFTGHKMPPHTVPGLGPRQKSSSSFAPRGQSSGRFGGGNRSSGGGNRPNRGRAPSGGDQYRERPAFTSNRDGNFNDRPRNDGNRAPRDFSDRPNSGEGRVPRGFQDRPPAKRNYNDKPQRNYQDLPPRGRTHEKAAAGSFRDRPVDRGAFEPKRFED